MKPGIAIQSASVHFDDTPIEASQATLVSPISPLRVLLLEAAKAVGSLRDTASIREQVMSLIFSITPADRAAVLINDSISGRHRDLSEEPVSIRRGIID